MSVYYIYVIQFIIIIMTKFETVMIKNKNKYTALFIGAVKHKQE